MTGNTSMGSTLPSLNTKSRHNNGEHSLPVTNFVGARKGAIGTVADLKDNPPVPKAWVNPTLIQTVIDLLSDNQSQHSRLDLRAILHDKLYDPNKQRYRVLWSKNMITSAGVSSVNSRGTEELVLHLRDGNEERGSNKRWMRQILESLYKKDGKAKQAVEDFLYLTLVHEASEIHQRNKADTLRPDIKAEIRAEIEEAKAYFALPPDRRKILKQVYQLLDESAEPGLKVFSRELELFENIGEEKLGSIEGLLAMIEFVVGSPDYAREANIYPDERTRLQLARSLFVDILHDFAGANRADKWVKELERIGTFDGKPVSFEYTEHTAKLSEQAEEKLTSAARVLETLKVSGAEESVVPSTKQKKRIIENFNGKIEQLDAIKSQLKPNEVLSIPAKLKSVLEDNTLNRHFSYMDRFGIYHSLNLSRLDLRGLDLHSGRDERSEKDINRDINQHKDERSDLRGAHMVGSDLSQRANFSGAMLDFVVAAFSNLCEINFTRTRAIGMVLYGANANEAQFEHAKLTAADARGMSANFARVQMQETDVNGMKVWQSDVPSWQRAYVDISKNTVVPKENDANKAKRESLKAELDFLDDSFLDELDGIEESDDFKSEENWIELREVDGQLEFLKGRGIVFYSRDETLEYSLARPPEPPQPSSQEQIAC